MSQYFDIIPQSTPSSVLERSPQPAVLAINTQIGGQNARVGNPLKNMSLQLMTILCIAVGLILFRLGTPAKEKAVITPSISLPKIVASNQAVAPAVSTPPPAPRPLWGLSIPSLNIDVAIQKVGKTKRGDIGVPSNNTDVAWYNQSVMPGQIGNSVITGHLNGGENTSAVFGNLKLLKVGDMIYVNDNHKKTQLRFVVVDKQSYDVSNAPLGKIIGPSQNRGLNLITCSGKWNRAKKDYSQRLVIFTKLAT